MGEARLREIAAPTLVSRDQLGLRLQRHRVDDQPAARRQRFDIGLQGALGGRAAADEDGVRRGQIPGGVGRAALDDAQRGNPERERVAGDARRAFGMMFDRDGAIGDVGEHPFDGNRTRPGADIPEEFAAPGRQGAQRHRAGLALGDLAVVLEEIVRKAGHAGNDARALARDDLERDGVQRGDIRDSKA